MDSCGRTSTATGSASSIGNPLPSGTPLWTAPSAAHRLHRPSPLSIPFYGFSGLREDNLRVARRRHLDQRAIISRERPQRRPYPALFDLSIPCLTCFGSQARFRLISGLERTCCPRSSPAPRFARYCCPSCGPSPPPASPPMPSGPAPRPRSGYVARHPDDRPLDDSSARRSRRAFLQPRAPRTRHSAVATLADESDRLPCARGRSPTDRQHTPRPTCSSVCGASLVLASILVARDSFCGRYPMGRINAGIKATSGSAPLGSAVYFVCRHMLYRHLVISWLGFPL